MVQLLLHIVATLVAPCVIVIKPLQNLKKKNEINLQVEKRGVTAYYSLTLPEVVTEENGDSNE